MRILLTNDDGIRSPGLRALGEVFSGAGHRVFVCAPDRERSAASHSATFGRPLRAEPVALDWAERAWAADGTPADCASLGLFLSGGADIAISGINRGMNMGGACVYSGTVGAALEAAMCGTQALAVSLFFDPRKPEEEDYAPAARVALRVAEWMPEHPLPLGAMYNLNVPAIPYERLRGIVAARLAPVFLDPPDYERVEDDGRGAGWVYRSGPMRAFAPDSDMSLAGAGYATLTKLTWDFRMNGDDGELNGIPL